MTSVRASVGTVALGVVLVRLGLPVAADQTWVEVTSQHFTVVSNAGEGRARSIAWQFEQIRSAIDKGWPWSRGHQDRPVVVIAAKDELTMKALAPRYWEKGAGFHPASVFASAIDRHYIALRSDLEGDGTVGVNPYRSSYLSYSTIALQSSFDRGLPLWFINGLSEVLGNTIVTDSEIQFGRPVPDSVDLLRREPSLGLARLMSVSRDSPDFTREEERRRFDRQSWALMQYLLFGFPDRETRETRVNELARLILGGTPSGAAVDQVFGSVQALDDAYRLYVGQGLFRYARLKVDTDVSKKSFVARTLTSPEAAVVRAGFHAGTGRPAEARADLEEAAKDPRLAATYEIQGKLFDLENNHDAAQQAYAKAAELNSENFYLYYRLASLTWRPNADADALANAQKLLARSVSLNDAFAPACDLLANVLTRLGQPANALGPARQAVLLEPGQSSYRLSLARILWRLSQRDEALKEARAALAIARTDQQRRDAQTLIDSFERRLAYGAGPSRTAQKASPTNSAYDLRGVSGEDCAGGEMTPCPTDVSATAGAGERPR